ncbi:hypothetical protein Aph02nite_35310 [Actinoplanes philippinensis]|nr:hypothetical protein Aph02nite_35310 [Actinoplanes philippinensis]
MRERAKTGKYGGARSGPSRRGTEIHPTTFSVGRFRRTLCPRFRSAPARVGLGAGLPAWVGLGPGRPAWVGLRPVFIRAGRYSPGRLLPGIGAAGFSGVRTADR